MIKALRGFGPHRVFHLPLPCHRPFLFHLPFPSLPSLIISLFFSRVLLFAHFAVTGGLQSSKLCFSPFVRSEGPHPQRLFSSLTSSSARVIVLTAANHSPSSTYSHNESLRNASSGIWSAIICLQTIPVTLACMLRFSISSNNLAISPGYLTKPISHRDVSASRVGTKPRSACSAKTFWNSYPACLV